MDVPLASCDGAEPDLPRPVRAKVRESCGEPRPGRITWLPGDLFLEPIGRRSCIPVDPMEPRPVPRDTAPSPRAGGDVVRQPGWRSADVLRAAALVLGLYLALQLLWLAHDLLLIAFLGVL